MLHETNLTHPPERLTTYFDTYFANRAGTVRQRAILVQARNGGWQLLACVITPIDEGGPLDGTRTLSYPGAVLYEAWLDKGAFAAFLREVQAGTLSFGDMQVQRQTQPSWTMTQFPLANETMPRAGFAISCVFETGPISQSDRPLLAVGLPYFPDLGEAVRDWSRLKRHNGFDDARNRCVLFLLPEMRAYFKDASQDEGGLTLSIDGTDKDRVLYAKGAYWIDGQIQHVEARVEDGRARLSVPDTVQRLEYVLTDADGDIYDFQREMGTSHSGLPRRRTLGGDQALVETVRSACLAGEGEHIEFKPFIELGSGPGENKLKEVAKTAVAFANGSGGNIFVGVDDACQPHSVAPALARWGNCAAADAAERYRGALLNAIIGEIETAIALSVSSVVVNGALLFVVSVQAGGTLVNLRGDTRLYVRTGASNRQVPPGQWPGALGEISFQ
jgi:hypothetical protein